MRTAKTKSVGDARTAFDASAGPTRGSAPPLVIDDPARRLVRAELMRLVMRLPRLRVLVHSRHTSLADDACALEAGCDGVLHKPGSAGPLIGEVRRLDGSDAVEPGATAANRGPS